MRKVLIYTTPTCGYCLRAKRLLNEKSVPFEEIDVSRDFKLRQEMVQKAGGRMTVPQIFIDGRHIGGCDELYDLEHAGSLDSLLAAA
jgi:glutaredoxin 3